MRGWCIVYIGMSHLWCHRQTKKGLKKKTSWAMNHVVVWDFKAIHVNNFEASLQKAERWKILCCFSPCSATTDMSGYQDMHWMKPLKPHLVRTLPNTREHLWLCIFLTNLGMLQRKQTFKAQLSEFPKSILLVSSDTRSTMAYQPPPQGKFNFSSWPGPTTPHHTAHTSVGREKVKRC